LQQSKLTANDGYAIHWPFWCRPAAGNSFVGVGRVIPSLKFAWRAVFAALQRTPVLFVTTFLALLLEYWIWQEFGSLVGAPYEHAAWRTADSHAAIMHDPYELTHALLNLPRFILQAFTIAPLAVSTHRLALVGEWRDKALFVYSRRDLRFGAWVALSFAMSSILSIISAILGNGGWSLLLFFVLYISITIISLRFALIFPSMAIDLHRPLRLSFTATKGHTIRILVSIITIFVLSALLPTAVLWLPLRLIARAVAHFDLLALQTAYKCVSYVVINACVTVFVAGMAATGSYYLTIYAPVRLGECADAD
jgi:hypothetical protein